MALLVYKTRCKKCSEEVVYYWRNCPYCGSRRFSRHISYRPPTTLGRDYLTVGCALIFSCTLFFLYVVGSHLKIWPSGFAVYDNIIIAIPTIVPLVIVVFIGLVNVCKFYIIDPVLHYSGEKVTITSVAKSCHYKKKRMTAIQHLIDQNVLADVAKNANYSDVRMAAAEKLIDQTIIQDVYGDIAKNDKEWKVRQTAVEKLTDQSVLADVAKTDTDSVVRMAAVKKLTDQSVLADVAKNGNYSDVRMAAAEKLIDQTIAQDVYGDIAKNDKEWKVRQTVVEKLTDQDVLTDVAKTGSIAMHV